MIKRLLPLLAAATLLWLIPLEARELTFFVVSDTHYGLSPEGDRTIPQLVEKMNVLPGTLYPPLLGGTVGVPSGVIHIGDITNDGKKESWDRFVHDYGLTGREGVLKFPVYETFGNHDGGPTSVVRSGIRERNKQRVGLKALSSNGLHYSWDWQGVHFVCCGISPGTTVSPYDPEHSLEFLQEDLKRSSGSSAGPIILFHHFGFDKDHSLRWWSEEWRTTYYEQIKNFPILAILHGHAHRPLIYQWNGIAVYHPPHFQQKPPKETGPVTHGFFVFHITDTEISVAERKLDDSWGMT